MKKSLYLYLFSVLFITKLQAQTCPNYLNPNDGQWVVCAFKGSDNYSTNYVGNYVNTSNAIPTTTGAFGGSYTPGTGDLEFDTGKHGH